MKRCQISSLCFCDFCSSAAFTVTHLCLHSLPLHCESKHKPSPPYPLISLSSLCARQSSYQGPGISQASTTATTVPYSQTAGNNSSAIGNAQGPAYNMPSSGIQLLPASKGSFVMCKCVFLWKVTQGKQVMTRLPVGSSVQCKNLNFKCLKW